MPKSHIQLGRIGMPWKMRGSILMAVLAMFLSVFISVATAKETVSLLNTPPSHIKVCLNAYLFEFESEPGSAEAAAEVAAFLANAKGLKSVTIRHVFGKLLNAVSAQVLDEDDLSFIMDMKQLRAVTPLTVVSPPEQAQPSQHSVVTSALEMTEVLQVHKELNLTGSGVKVGIIDTGIDYRHPALGGCFGKKCRVAYGWDFVGNEYNGSSHPKEGPNPLDCNGHGTHVAGIIGASDDAVTGTAPQVILGAYRVLGCNGSTNDDVIIAALERAISDGMDVINLSIGQPDGWPMNPVQRATFKAQSTGTMITVSQGNENNHGLFSANYAAEGEQALAVASLINTRILLSYFTMGQSDFRYVFQKTDYPGFNGTLPLIAPLNGTTLSNGCDPFTQDFTGKVVLILRGDCVFVIKAKHALERGAVGVLFANNKLESFLPDLQNTTIAAGALSQYIGEKIFEQLKAAGAGADNTVTAVAMVEFGKIPAVFVNPAGGSLSLFNSYGLDNELHIKPDIGAPGENIYSTWLTEKGNYQTLSGTSMASPHVAGALALIIEQWRRLTGTKKSLTWPQVQLVYSTIKNTAEPSYVYDKHKSYDLFSGGTTLTPVDGNETSSSGKSSAFGPALESVARQGSGMLNVYRAIGNLYYHLQGIGLSPSGSATSTVVAPPAGANKPISWTFVSPPSIELNDTEWGVANRTQTLSITNYGSDEVHYKLFHVPSESLHEYGIEGLDIRLKHYGPIVDSSQEVEWHNVTYDNSHQASVVFSQETFTVPAGGTVSVVISFTPPSGLPEDEHWIYSGYIVVHASSSSMESFNSQEALKETIHVPYAGVNGRMKTLPIFLHPTLSEMASNNRTQLCQVLGASVENKTTYEYSLADNDFPIITFCLQNPSRMLILELLKPGSNDTSSIAVDQSSNPAMPGSEDFSQDTDYTFYGRIAYDEFTARGIDDTILTAVKWDGTIDPHETRTIVSTDSRKTIDGDDIIHPEMGMRHIYDMSVNPARKSDEKSEWRPDRVGSRTAVLERGLEEIQEQGLGSVWKRSVGGGSLRQYRRMEPGVQPAGSNELESKHHKKHKEKEKLKENSKEKGTPVPDGRYRLRLRALRILGDIDNPQDYEVWVTRTFELKRPQ